MEASYLEEHQFVAGIRTTLTNGWLRWFSEVQLSTISGSGGNLPIISETLFITAVGILPVTMELHMVYHSANSCRVKGSLKNMRYNHNIRDTTKTFVKLYRLTVA